MKRFVPGRTPIAVALLALAAQSAQAQQAQQTTEAAAKAQAVAQADTKADAKADTKADPTQAAKSKEDARPKDDPPAERPQLERVEVTASKRVERLESVPLAISVFTSERLERSNVRSLEDVIELTPALTVTYGSTPANNGLNMRGIGTSSIGIGVESDVSVIIDDVPMSAQFMAFRDLADVQRVEVLKGPQSTLFGKSAIAGAMLITTKPIGGALRGDASAFITDDGEKRLRVSMGGEIAPRLGLRIAAAGSEFDGNLNNLATGKKVNGSRDRTLMMKLAWHPTDEIDVELTPTYNKTRNDCCTYALTSFGNLQSGYLSGVAALPASRLLAGITPGPANRDVRMDSATGIESETKGASLRINYAAPNGMALTSITSTQRYTANDYRDQDFTDVHTLLYFPIAPGKSTVGRDAGYVQYGTYVIDSKTQELRLTSSDTGNLRYVAGLWWASTEIDRTFVRGFDGIALSTPIAYFGDTSNRNTAIYGQASWEFRPGTTLVAGLRQNHQVSGYGLTLGNPPPADFTPTASYSSRHNKEDSTTGKLSLQHQFTPGVMAYVMTSTGYKGKAYDITSGLTAQTAAQQPVPSESARHWELGMKGNFFANRLTVNLAAFDTRFKDYQQNSGGYLPGTSTYVTRLSSIGGVQTRGLEMDVAALVTPDFIVNADVAYTRATVSDWPNAPCYNVGGTANGGFNPECIRNNPVYGGQNTQDLAGGVMPNAPRWKLGLSGRYDLALTDAPFNLFFSGNLRHRGEVQTNINQDPSLISPAVTVVNVGFGLKAKGGRYQIGLFVNNLFDRHYANTGFTGLGTWRVNPTNSGPSQPHTTWTPARDAFRYTALRLDAKF
ncbi:TonB-dependent receptor [Roseateles chitinivorans]|uniref:TonB-dependent receptor n=1 Tax=Roseateles chitinivorans TaxID=2917965 RepID=UPI003D67A6BF